MQPIPRDQLLLIIRAIPDGIAQRGKAEPGQKTMLDARHRTSEAMLAQETVASVARRAAEGAAATTAMSARMGRAERLQGRPLDHPGAAAVH